MKKRFSTKLISTVLSVAIAAMGTLVCPLSASAAADDDQIVVPIYLDTEQGVDQMGPSWNTVQWSIGGYYTWNWRNNGSKASTDRIDGVTVRPGFPSSDKVRWIEFNVLQDDGTLNPSTVATGDFVMQAGR